MTSARSFVGRTTVLVSLVAAVSFLMPPAVARFMDAATPRFTPEQFNLPSFAREVVSKRTEKTATFEISHGKFAQVSGIERGIAPSCHSKFCSLVSPLRDLLPSVFAITAGPNDPGAIADIANQANWTFCSPLNTWTNPGNAAGSDNTFATFSVTTGTRTTTCLKATSFGFSIPAGATIDGVTLGIERKSSVNSGTDYTKDASVYLVKGGIPSGSDKGDTVTKWPVVEASATYGGATDLWGTSFTSSDVNATNFGVTLNVSISAEGA